MRRLFILSLLVISVISARSETTDPVGFVGISLLANSDTMINPPFTRPVEYTGTVGTASGNTITVSGTPWTANQFVYVPGSQPKHYYVLIGPASSSNPKEGHTYAVTANSNNSLTVDTAQDNVTGTTVGAQLLIIPYWTPATIFPASNANASFTPTTSSASYKTQLLIPDYAASGINQPYATTYFFSNNVDGTSNNIGWRVVGDNLTSHDDDPLLPDGYMAVRNQNGAPTLTLTTLGGALTKKLAVALNTSASQQQDNAVSMVRPVDVPLRATGLTPSDSSFVSTAPSSGGGLFVEPADQLLLFDNTTAGFNKLPSAVYYFTKKEGWHLLGDPQTDHGNDLIRAGSALIVRKAVRASGLPAFWTNSPTY